VLDQGGLKISITWVNARLESIRHGIIGVVDGKDPTATGQGEVFTEGLALITDHQKHWDGRTQQEEVLHFEAEPGIRPQRRHAQETWRCELGGDAAIGKRIVAVHAGNIGRSVGQVDATKLMVKNIPADYTAKRMANDTALSSEACCSAKLFNN
jgi:hypothetical protein